MNCENTLLLMQKKHLLLAFFFIFFLSYTNAQETWSLRKCIEYAEQNNLTLKSAKYNIEDAKLLEKRAKLARTPNLSGTSTFGFQFGRTVDPTTNSFRNQRIGFNSYNLNANVTVFDGGRIRNTARQSNIDVEAAKANADFTFNSLALSIANAYLQILMAQEQVENAKKRLDLSQKQLDQTDKMIQAGTLPQNDRLDVEAQIARDEQSIIQNQNTLDINYLNLRQLLELPPDADFKIERPEVIIPADANPEAKTFGEVYSAALGTQPQIRADELRLRSADVGVNLAKAGYFPTLSLFGGLNTNWSSASKDFQNPNLDNATLIQGPPTDAVINGEPGQIAFFNSTGITFPDVSFFDQLDQNFGQNAGFSINIPFYSQGRNKVAVERAQVNVLNARVQSEQTKQQLKTDVLNAITSARAAKRSLEAAQKSKKAAEAAFHNSEKRFQLGAINTFEFTTARNNFDIASVDVIVAKYEYLFRLKIVDFYLGKQLELK